MFRGYKAFTEYFSDAGTTTTSRAAAWGMQVSISKTIYMQFGRAWSL